jgi:hypothetical protein
LNSRDDNLLAAFDELPQVAGAFGMADGRANLEKVFDRLVELIV